MTKTKQQLRAEAVERLQNWPVDAKSGPLLDTLLGKSYDPYDYEKDLVALIDLLTDDCDTECYECAKLAELMAENNALREMVDELEAERDEWKTKCETREVAYKQADAERKRYSEQIDELRAELQAKVDAQRDRSDETATCNNSGAFVTDSREQLEEDANGYVMSWWQSDWVDSFGHADSMKRDIMRLLDRQEAIIERECLVQSVQGADAILTAENAELQARIDELAEQLEDAEYDCATCAAKNELQARVDELTENYEASSRALEILTSDKATIITKCSQLCAACGYTMVDASGTAI